MKLTIEQINEQIHLLINDRDTVTNKLSEARSVTKQLEASLAELDGAIKVAQHFHSLALDENKAETQESESDSE